MSMDKNKVVIFILKLNLWLALIICFIGFIGLSIEIIHNGNYNYIFAENLFSTHIIELGILLLLVMPITRVVLEFIFFIKNKNYEYIIICLLLFAIVVASIVC